MQNIEILAYNAAVPLIEALTGQGVTIRGDCKSPAILSKNEVGAYVGFDGLEASAPRKMVVTADWTPPGEIASFDFILWVNPGQKIELEIVNYTGRWEATSPPHRPRNIKITDRPSS